MTLGGCARRWWQPESRAAGNRTIKPEVQIDCPIDQVAIGVAQGALIIKGSGNCRNGRGLHLLVEMAGPSHTKGVAGQQLCAHKNVEPSMTPKTAINSN